MWRRYRYTSGYKVPWNTHIRTMPERTAKPELISSYYVMLMPTRMWNLVLVGRETQRTWKERKGCISPLFSKLYLRCFFSQCYHEGAPAIPPLFWTEQQWTTPRLHLLQEQKNGRGGKREREWPQISALFVVYLFSCFCGSYMHQPLWPGHVGSSTAMDGQQQRCLLLTIWL